MISVVLLSDVLFFICVCSDGWEVASFQMYSSLLVCSDGWEVASFHTVIALDIFCSFVYFLVNCFPIHPWYCKTAGQFLGKHVTHGLHLSVVCTPCLVDVYFRRNLVLIVH